MKKYLLLLSVLVILLIAQVSNATQFSGVASQSMGGTGRAAVLPNEVAFLNPASFVSVRGYNLSTAYRDFSTHYNTSVRNFAVHASENQTDSAFPLAVTYLRTTNQFQEMEDIHLTTGQVIFGSVAFGVDIGRYKFESRDSDWNDTEWDAKLGFLYAPADTVGLGLVFSNLLSTDHELLNRQVEFGVNYLFLDFFRAALDITHQIEDNPTDESVVMLGLEHTLLKQVPLRAGFKWDAPINQNYWTLGLGWTAPKLALAYSYEKNVDENDEYGHSVDLRIYF